MINSKLFYLMGKSSTGKDTIYNLLKEAFPKLKPVVLHTTRPKRAGEVDGETYWFDDENTFKKLLKDNKIAEYRKYDTVNGAWYYYTTKESLHALEMGFSSYISIGTLESYMQIKKYYGEYIIPIYICVDDNKRLTRAIRREKKQVYPNYKEVCRRFLADEEDFSDDKLKAAGISEKYIFSNDGNLSSTIKDISFNLINKYYFSDTVSKHYTVEYGSNGYYAKEIK